MKGAFSIGGPKATGKLAQLGSREAEQAHRLCEHMRGDRIIIGKDTAVPMSLSIGVAQYRPGTDDWRTLLERADQALYRAKNDGRWEKAYESQSKAELPADFAEALPGNEKAAAFYATLDSANRYAIVYRLHSAKKPETRQKRFDSFLAMLARGEKLH